MVSSDCIRRFPTDVPQPEELINSGPVSSAITAVGQKDCVVPTSVLLPGVDSLLPMNPLLPNRLGVTALNPLLPEHLGVKAFCEAPRPCITIHHCQC